MNFQDVWKLGKAGQRVWMGPRLLREKRKIYGVKKCTFPRNRLGEIIRDTVCKVLEDIKEISDSYHRSIKTKSCQGNQTPCGNRDSDLIDGEKQ